VSASEVVDGATLVLPARFGTLSLVAVTGAGDAPLNLTPAVLDGANCSLLKLGRLDAEISLVATYR
jgi:hypothetical protein